MYIGAGVTDASISGGTELALIRDGEIHLNARGSSDSGLNFAVQVELEAFTSALDQIDENWARVDGAFGEAAPWAKFMPEGAASVYDYVFEKGKKEWKLWIDTIAKEDTKISADLEFTQIVVPTMDTARYSFLLTSLLARSSSSSRSSARAGSSGRTRPRSSSSSGSSLFASSSFRSTTLGASSRARRRVPRRLLHRHLLHLHTSACFCTATAAAPRACRCAPSSSAR